MIERLCFPIAIHRTKFCQVILAAGIASLLWISTCLTAIAAPKADLWPKWQKHNSHNKQTISHSPWNFFLKHYLDRDHISGVHRINYKMVKKEDQQLLSNYIKTLESISISSYSRSEQAAYWINLYNALTIKVILDHYPVESILKINISPGFFNFGPWDAKLLQIEGEELSLNDIEHRILRPIWKNPLIHYAVNCASIGCPNLAPVPYTSKNMETLLEQGAKNYINHPRGVTFKDDELWISKIYIWFEEDFMGNQAGILQHLQKYASSKLAKQLQSYDGDIESDYNWNLNEP
ncbi:MAG: DUF547 domain-containing protein [SAR324 cluster bacterium]|nr:DUF547 domain-containing protein [SAR324 cluster bacterium]